MYFTVIRITFTNPRFRQYVLSCALLRDESIYATTIRSGAVYVLRAGHNSIHSVQGSRQELLTQKVRAHCRYLMYPESSHVV